MVITNIFVTVALSDMRKMEPEGHMVALETENKQLKVCSCPLYITV